MLEQDLQRQSELIFLPFQKNYVKKDDKNMYESFSISTQEQMLKLCNLGEEAQKRREQFSEEVNIF